MSDALKLLNSTERIIIDNCILYDINDNFNNSSFNCLKCKEEYYLDNNICKERKNDYNECLIKNIEKDSCNECNNYLSSLID